MGFFVKSAIVLSLAFSLPAYARDLDGRFAQNPLHEWFNQLASKKGLCCSFADGATIKTDDWQSNNGHYEVRLYNRWVVIPDNAIVTEPNKAGEAVVWPYLDENNQVQIRCFLPGAGT